MIDPEELTIVHYCHPYCIPLQNIVRLPKEEAFVLANKLAAANPDTTAFYRFADFENYYDLRIRQDRWMYDTFVSLGGKPKEHHPLSFVLQGSSYLADWFGNGTVTKIPLKGIPAECVSFTWGDSGAQYNRGDSLTLNTKEAFTAALRAYRGTLDSFLEEVALTHRYIEVQVWDDAYCVCT